MAPASDDRSVEAMRMLGFFYVAGALGGLIVAAIVWRSPIAGWSASGLAIMSAGAIPFGVVLAFSDAVQKRQIIAEVMNPAAAALVAVAVIRYATAPNTGFVLSLWPVMWAFTYLPTGRAVLQTVLVSGALITIFAVQPGWTQPAVYVLFVLFTFVVTGVVVSRLVKRAEAHAARERDANAQLHALNLTLEERVQTQVSEITGLGRLRRFLSPQVAEALLSSDDDAILSPHRREIAVVFCDLRGFTSLAAGAEPEDVTAILRDYHRVLGELVDRHAATVGGFAGDGVLLYFNDPIPCDDPAQRAVRMALDLARPMAELEDRWARRGFRVGYGVGIAFGYATLGMTGFESRSDYTALGTVVNLASRLSDEAGRSEVLLDARANEAVEHAIPTECVGDRSLKGFDQPVPVYRVAGERDI